MTNEEKIAQLEQCRQEKGALNARTLVDYATPEDSPLHNYFEWSDSHAAQLYREHQARCFIHSVKIVYKDDQNKAQEAPAFVAIKYTDSPGLREYESTIKVLSDDERREKLLAQAKEELDAFIQRYGSLTGLSNILQDGLSTLAA